MEIVEVGTLSQGNFLWEQHNCDCYFTLKASHATLYLEAANSMERNQFVDGFRKLCLTGPGRGGSIFDKNSNKHSYEACSGVQDGQIAGTMAADGAMRTQEMQAAFKVFDSDGNGTINRFELGSL